MINLNRFDLVSLRLFVAVVDAGSLTAGAGRFGISLAAASKRIAELEQHCGMPLLQRGQRGVTATRHGQTLHRHAIEIVAKLEQLALAVDDANTGASGHLRLWANPSALGGFLPRALAAYARENPSVRIDLEDAMSEDSVRAVHKGVAELAVIGANTPCDGLESLVCDADELVLVTHAAHPLAAHAGEVPFAEALGHDFVTIGRSASLTRLMVTAAEEAGQALRIRMQVRSFDTACRLVAQGLGVALLPRGVTRLFAQSLDLKLLAVSGIDVRRQLLLVMRRRDTLSPAAAAMVALVERGTG